MPLLLSRLSFVRVIHVTICVCAFGAMLHVASDFMHPLTASLAADSSCQGPGHQEVMGEMLRQAETQCHKKARRLVWLEAIKPVFAVSPFPSL